VSEPSPGDVTKLLSSWRAGDTGALQQLTPLVYRELRNLARAYLRRERPDHTLQPTALVHEAWMRLVDQTHLESHSRSQFFAIAANLMRQILVDHARQHQALKRGGGNKVELVEDAAHMQPRGVDLIALDEALSRLAVLNRRQSQIVELRFFGGLTEEEIADVLAVSVPTVKRDWRVARALLYQQLRTPDAQAADSHDA
jgi:RNA polymerase sigma factor (TIGR02999 family)